MRRVRFRAVREARVKDGTFDVAIGVWVYTAAWFGGRRHLQVPWTPVCRLGIGEGAFPRKGVARIGGVAVGARGRGCGQKTGRGNTGGVGEIGRDILQVGVVAGDVDDSYRKVVAIDEGDVVECLLVASSALKIKFSQSYGSYSLD